MGRVRDVAGILMVTAIMGVWLFQTVAEGQDVDFAVKTLALTFAAAGGISLFGKGTLSAAQKLMQNGRESRDDGKN